MLVLVYTRAIYIQLFYILEKEKIYGTKYLKRQVEYHILSHKHTQTQAKRYILQVVR